MLTKQDLKNIGDLIDTKLEEKLDSILESKFESKLSPIQKNLSGIKKDITEIKRDIKKINKNMERDFGFHETQNRYAIKNIQQIQKHLDMPIMLIESPDLTNY